MIEIIPPLGNYKYDTWRILPVKCSINNFVCFLSCIRNVNTANGERLTCGDFSLGETILLGSFEFIADYFGGLRLSPRRGHLGAAFMGSTHSESPSLWWVMIEDSTEEFLTTSSSDRGFGLPSPRSYGTGTPPTPSRPSNGRRTLRPLEP
jgi:hypothetical protein